MDEINKTQPKDISYSAGKAILGMIPIVGTAASELLGYIVTPPLEKRRAEWMEEVGQRLIKLEESNKIDIDKLSENEIFIDTIIQASYLALKTSDKKKITALKNAITNTALDKSADLAINQIFLNLIDVFTSWHIKILNLFNNPKNWFESRSIVPPNYMSGSLRSILYEAFPTLKIKMN